VAQNLASKYIDKVDERFKLGSLHKPFITNEYDWVGVNAINVYTVDTVAMGDYTRSGTARYGTAAELGTGLQTMTLTKDRAFTFTIDQGNHTEEMMVTKANKALKRQVDEILIPEVDTRVFAVMSAAAVANSSSAIAATTAANAYIQFLAGMEKLGEAKVPLKGLVAGVTPAFYSFLKQDNSFVRSSDMGQKMLVTGQIGEVDGVRIIMIPSTYFPANTAFILAHPTATVAPQKLQSYKIHKDPVGVSGWLVEGRTIYDAFVRGSKVDALYTHLIL